MKKAMAQHRANILGVLGYGKNKKKLSESMMKFANKDDAAKEAKKKNLYYGFSVFSNGFFVGTKEQLKKIGVVEPKQESIQTEAIHMGSFSPYGKMGFLKDPEWVSDPAQVAGIEIGDKVAFAHEPNDELGELIGITGFREAIVRDVSGSVQEYNRHSLVKYEDAGIL